MEREAVVQFQVLSLWGAHPRLRIARVNTGGAVIKGRLVRFGVPGTADICGVIAPWGRLLMIECKTARGKQRDAQITMQRVITSMGGLYVIARRIEDVDHALGLLGISR